MPYFILGLAILVGLYLLVRGLRGANPQNVRAAIMTVIVVAAAGMLVFLSATGRLGPLGWLALLLPFLLRWRHLRRMLNNLGGPSPGRDSDVETRYLRMTLEHDSGVLRGTVLEGAYRGCNLEEMPLDDLLDLLRECRVNDPESATVLEAYLDRVHGAEWRGAGSTEGAGQGEGARESAGRSGGGAMTRAQAYEILGLKPGVSEDEIRAAHRRLLKSAHPDHGGSTWLAAQINMAKDLLLPDG